MRCDVINIIELKTVTSNHENTDIEIWREASSYSKALVTSGPRDVAKYIVKNGNFVLLQKIVKDTSSVVGKRCQKSDTPEAANIKGECIRYISKLFLIFISKTVDYFFKVVFEYDKKHINNK